jgi:murein hydrolase activator
VRTVISTLVLVILALVAGAGPSGAAARDAELAHQLETLKARIGVIEKAQRELAERRDRESRALREAELAVARQSRALEETRRERQAVALRRDELLAHRAEMAAGLESDTDALAAELRAAWMAGGEPRLKLMLNQRDPAELGRMLTWYRYVARERAGRVAQLRERLAELAELGRRLDAESARLEAAETRQAEAVAALDAARTTRADAVTALDADLARRGEEAERLRGEAAALEQLLEELRAAVADLPVPEGAPFASQRGRLAWPVQGRLVRDFGERRGEGPRSNGVLIGAERGAGVQAVWHGRVAYADWLPGLGLLLVLEHGDGFMSLYGHNEVLFSAVGDWVTAGQVVGQVGDSGGRDQAGLYFEIRSGARPENPSPWFNERMKRR